MTALIKAELIQLLIMFYCGLAIMMVFTVRDRFIARCARYKRLCILIYLGSWLCAAFLFSHFLYRGSHGVVTMYGILAMAAGILLWKKAICGIIMSVQEGWRAEGEDRGDV
ncbi:MAG: spore cortex biosynthesis protein YabQ [Emergencia sp.]|nr:spore cortex biosynthesis protein YabQ [Emergencia sp.]